MVGKINFYKGEYSIGVVDDSLLNDQHNEIMRCCVKENAFFINDVAYIINENSVVFFSNLKKGDIVAVDSYGIVYLLYESAKKDAVLYTTNHCNSNCIICPISENIRKSNSSIYVQRMKNYIASLPKEVDHFCITGGEPTLLGNDLLSILEICKTKFQTTDFQLLTNGRSFSNPLFCKNFVENIPDNTEIDIPLHSSSSELHDYITQSKGSFNQTVIGIQNLLKFNQRVEIRIVVTALNCNHITELAQYIIDHFSNCLRVTFIGMELSGNAAKNRNLCWIDYQSAFNKIIEAINLLYSNSIDVYLFNFPLCTVDKRYWYLCKQSISPEKIRFYSKCNTCRVKQGCSGFFVSTYRLTNTCVNPIERGR